MGAHDNLTSFLFYVSHQVSQPTATSEHDFLVLFVVKVATLAVTLVGKQQLPDDVFVLCHAEFGLLLYFRT